MSHTPKRVNDRDCPELIPRLNKLPLTPSHFVKTLLTLKVLKGLKREEKSCVGPITVPWPVLTT